MKSHGAEMRALALRCVSLYCHASVKAALSFWPLLLKALQNDVEQVQLAALRAVVDLLHLHGPTSLLPSAAAPAAPPTAAPAAPIEDAHAAEIARLLLPLLEQPAGPLRVDEPNLTRGKEVLTEQRPRMGAHREGVVGPTRARARRAIRVIRCTLLKVPL